MTDANHTAGPWYYRDTPNDPDIAFTVLWQHAPVAEVYSANIAECSPASAEANARLIASAPDLLEACQEALAYCEHLKSSMFGVEPSHADNLRAAIARATGEAA